MRKQTKIAALVSAAALLAIGASMTSFAGWDHDAETGEYIYLDKDGERAYGEWKKDGANWYYLNEETGLMDRNRLIPYDSNSTLGTGSQYYYVDENGARVTGKWVYLENEEEITINEEEDIVPYGIWYYFGSNGRSYYGGQKDIDGVKYHFDDDSHMMVGWVSVQDSKGNTTTYYYNNTVDESDSTYGAAFKEWKWLPIPAKDAGATDEYDELDATEGWYYFAPNGSRYENDHYISGVWWHFNSVGVLQTGWQSTATPSVTNDNDPANYDENTGKARSGWVYKGEHGAWDCSTYGTHWFFVDAQGTPVAANDKYLNGKLGLSTGTAGKAEGVDADGYENANIDVVAIRVKNKTYLLDKYGRMLDGLFELTAVPVVKGGSDTLSGWYYFSEDAWTNGEGTNGAMATNSKITIYDEFDDPSYYYFGRKGKAYTNEIISNSLYDYKGKKVYSEYENYAEINLADYTNGDDVIADSKNTIAKEKSVLVSANGTVVKGRTVPNVEGYKKYYVGRFPSYSEVRSYIKDNGARSVEWSSVIGTPSVTFTETDAAEKTAIETYNTWVDGKKKATDFSAYEIVAIFR